MLRRLIATLLTCVLAAGPVLSAAVPDSSHCHGRAEHASADVHHPAAGAPELAHEHHARAAVPGAATEDAQSAPRTNADPHEDLCGCDCTCATGQGCAQLLALSAGSAVRPFAAGEQRYGTALTLPYGQRGPPPSPPPIR